MNFLSKNTKFRLSGLAILFSTSLLMSACNTTSAVSTSNTGVENQASQEVTKSVKENAPQAVDLTTAKAFEDIFNNAIHMFSINENISEKDVACLQGADKDYTLQYIQSMLQKYFTPKELQKTNEYFKSPLGQKMTKIQQQNIDAVFSMFTGKESDKELIEPTADEVKALQEFLQTPAGKKLAMLNGKVNPDTVKKIFEPVLNKKAKSCQIKDFNLDK